MSFYYKSIKKSENENNINNKFLTLLLYLKEMINQNNIREIEIILGDFLTESKFLNFINKNEDFLNEIINIFHSLTLSNDNLVISPFSFKILSNILHENIKLLNFYIQLEPWNNIKNKLELKSISFIKSILKILINLLLFENGKNYFFINKCDFFIINLLIKYQNEKSTIFNNSIISLIYNFLINLINLLNENEIKIFINEYLNFIINLLNNYNQIIFKDLLGDFFYNLFKKLSIEFINENNLIKFLLNPTINYLDFQYLILILNYLIITYFQNFPNEYIDLIPINFLQDYLTDNFITYLTLKEILNFYNNLFLLNNFKINNKIYYNNLNNNLINLNFKIPYFLKIELIIFLWKLCYYLPNNYLNEFFFSYCWNIMCEIFNYEININNILIEVLNKFKELNYLINNFLNDFLILLDESLNNEIDINLIKNLLRN